MAEGAKWVKTWINNLAALNDKFRDDEGRIDFEALGREEYAFRMALSLRDFSKSERAEEAWNDAQGRWEASVKNGKKGGRPKRNSESKKKDEKPNPKQEKLQPQNQQQPLQHAQPSAQKAAVKKPEQVVWGKFENVYLSQDEYNELARLIGNLNTAREMVDSLSAKLEDGSITSSNHYATLVYWANYRKNHPAEQKTFAERDAERQIQTLKRLGVVPNEFFNN